MRPILFTVALLASAVASGQCTLSTFLSAHPFCQDEPPYFDYVAGVGINFFGGTPPYTYQIFAGSPVNLWRTGSTSGPGIAFGDPLPVNIPSQNYYSTVTDANGCVSTQGPVVCAEWRRVDPNAMTRTYIPGATTWTLRLTGGISPLSFGLSNLNYTLYSGTTAVANGTAASLYNSGQNSLDLSAIPPGSYRLVISKGPSSSPFWCQANTDLLFTLPQVSDVGVNVQMSAALRGPMGAQSLMIDSLRAHGSLPAAEPYSAMGYTYSGTTAGAMMSPSLLATTGAQAIVDWVVIELRSSSAPYAVVASRPALIRRDGEVVDLDGDPYLNFSGLAAGNYRASLRHRNHLGVMSTAAVGLQVIPARFTFRTGTAYGTSPQTSIGGVFCLWPGDVNFDGTTKYAGSSNDRDPILTLIGGITPTNTLNNVYNGADLNLDGQVKYAGSANDRDIILQTVGGSVPTATRAQQLP